MRSFLAGLWSRAESRFSLGSAWTDPDQGVARALKVSGGLAILGGLKTDTLTVTETAALAGERLATRPDVGSQGFTDDMAHAPEWVITHGTRALASIASSEATNGGTLTEATGSGDARWWNPNWLIPFDAGALYKLTVRFRRLSAPAGTGTVYFGLAMLDEARAYVNTSNITVSSPGSSAFWVLAAGLNPTPNDAWITRTAYIKGRTAGASTYAGSADSLVGAQVAARTRYVAPAMILGLGGDGLGTFQVDYFELEILSGDDLVVHKAGPETITGDKTFTGVQTFTGDLITSHADTTFSAPATSYRRGITYGNASTANGWPVSLGTVMTVYYTGSRVFQWLVPKGGLGPARVRSWDDANGGVWSAFTVVADDASVVHLTGAETITGVKTFNSAVVAKSGLDPKLANGKLASATPDTYPFGISTASVTGNNGWPVNGVCTTIANEGRLYTTQLLISQAAGETYTRGSANGLTWSAWSYLNTTPAAHNFPPANPRDGDTYFNILRQVVQVYGSGVWRSVGQGVVAERRINHVTNPVPTGSTTGWRASSGESVSFGIDADGTHYLELRDDVGWGYGYLDPNISFKGRSGTLRVGDKVRFSVDVWPLDAATATVMRLRIPGYGGVTTSEPNGAPFQPIPMDQWTRLHLTATVTANTGGTAGYVRCLVWPNGVAAPGNGFRARRALVEISASLPAEDFYFSGSSDEARWLGTPGLSESTLGVDDANLVHRDGAETISGAKTFTGSVVTATPDRLFSDPITAYPGGVTYGNATSGDGWPCALGTVQTTNYSAYRAFQIIVESEGASPTGGGRVWAREFYLTGWNDLVELTSSAVSQDLADHESSVSVHGTDHAPISVLAVQGGAWHQIATISFGIFTRRGEVRLSRRDGTFAEVVFDVYSYFDSQTGTSSRGVRMTPTEDIGVDDANWSIIAAGQGNDFYGLFVRLPVPGPSAVYDVVTESSEPGWLTAEAIQADPPFASNEITEAQGTDDSVHLTGTETITGEKTFTAPLRAASGLDLRIDNGKFHADGPDTYPYGFSTASVTLGNGWPCNGILRTYVQETGRNYSTQDLTDNVGTVQWSRSSSNGTSWSSWRRLMAHEDLPVARAWHSVARSTPAAAFTVCTFDTNGYASPGTRDPAQPTRFYAPVSGIYNIVGQIAFANSTAGRRILTIRRNANGSTNSGAPIVTSELSPHANTFYLPGVMEIALQAGEYFEMFSYHTHSAALQVLAGEVGTTLAMSYRRTIP